MMKHWLCSTYKTPLVSNPWILTKHSLQYQEKNWRKLIWNEGWSKNRSQVQPWRRVGLRRCRATQPWIDVFTDSLIDNPPNTLWGARKDVCIYLPNQHNRFETTETDRGRNWQDQRLPGSTFSTVATSRLWSWRTHCPSWRLCPVTRWTSWRKPWAITSPAKLVEWLPSGYRPTEVSKGASQQTNRLSQGPQSRTARTLCHRYSTYRKLPDQTNKMLNYEKDDKEPRPHQSWTKSSSFDRERDTTDSASTMSEWVSDQSWRLTPHFSASGIRLSRQPFTPYRTARSSVQRMIQTTESDGSFGKIPDRRGWSAYGLSRAHRYHLELNWTELN